MASEERVRQPGLLIPRAIPRVTELYTQSENMLATLQGVIKMINSYSLSDPEYGHSHQRIDPSQVLAQVYGDIGSQFANFKKAVEEAKEYFVE